MALTLGDEYQEQLESNFADMANIGVVLVGRLPQVASCHALPVSKLGAPGYRRYRLAFW